MHCIPISRESEFQPPKTAFSKSQLWYNYGHFYVTYCFASKINSWGFKENLSYYYWTKTFFPQNITQRTGRYTMGTRHCGQWEHQGLWIPDIRFQAPDHTRSWQALDTMRIGNCAYQTQCARRIPDTVGIPGTTGTRHNRHWTLQTAGTGPHQ